MFSLHFHGGYQEFPISLNELKAPKALIRNLKTEVSLWKRIKCFPSALRWRNFKTQQSPVILDLCLRKTRSEKSHDYRDVIVFETFRFQNVLRPHKNEKQVFSNSSSLKSVFEKLRFRDGLVWTVGLTVEIKSSRVVWTRPNSRLLEMLILLKFRGQHLFFAQHVVN